MPSIRCLLLVLLGALVACGEEQQSQPDAVVGPPCSDGVDNDGDGAIDYPDDRGCADDQDDSEDGETQCLDGRDNDGDGKIDYPNDPGCVVPQVDDETDPCPGPGCPQCADGIDNDSNGKTDFPDDLGGCMSAGDEIEFTDNNSACGQGMVILPLPTNGVATGTLAGSVSNLSSPCGGGGGVPGIAYLIHLSSPKVIVASTDDQMTDFDTVLDLRAMNCSDPSAEIACHDDISSGTSGNKKSKLTRSLKAGNYYLIVQSKTMTPATTNYTLKVEFFPGEGTPCTTAADCGPELLCRVPFGQTAMVCAGPVCRDGVDDDGDGKIDYPNDPGCTSETDATENDVCATTPTDPSCPQCANGLDDDQDGNTDFPNDTTCAAASTIGELCPQSEDVIVATMPQTTSTTSGATNDFIPPKGQYNGHACTSTSATTMLTAPDRAIQLDVPAMSTLSLRVTFPSSSWDSAHILLNSSCNGTPIECYDSPTGMVVNNLAAGRYFFIVDGFSTASGAFTLNVSGTIKNGESCESPLAQSGAITCGAGHACRGASGSRTCAPTDCNDGMDNNGDGRMDYPGDPGCASLSDLAEDTVCPGTDCPVCSDGADNDGDTLIDYPTDTDCIAASGTSEGCPESDQITAITMPTTTGTLVGTTDDHDPKCIAATSDGPDRVYMLDIPATLQSLRIDTEGSAVDTVLSFMNTTCSEPSIACDDDGGVGAQDSLIQRSGVAAGGYAIAVDAFGTTLDTFVLNVQGTIAPGGSCESPLFQSGVLVCPPNFGCNGPAGSKTCTVAQCVDTVDNNGDGQADYPNDPGCDSPSDNTETTVCPGSSCPVCSDGMDNDSDGKTDYPADGRCTSASGTNEGCVDTDAIGSILMPITNGTLVGATNDHQPVCATTAFADLIYTLTVPKLESLTIDTAGSSIDTVLTLMTSDCMAPSLACNNGGAGNGDSLITHNLLQAGTYTIAVDSDVTGLNTFVLNVSGVISPGESCESPLFATGVLRCSQGFQCDGPMGMRTCALAECADGIDNNGDGRMDFPVDPGCDSFSDDAETTVCPGPACPVCSDGLDNDGDGKTDFPADPRCVVASGTNEACVDTDAIAAILMPTTSGTLVGTTDDHQPSCTTTTGVDAIYTLTVPNLESLTINTHNSVADTVLSLMTTDCSEPAIACDNDSGIDLSSMITRSSVLAGTYTIAVDDDTTIPNAYVLNVQGVISPGESCESPLVATGVLSCGLGFACKGPMGMRTCALADCIDGLDNNNDGKTDFPTDPGCDSFSDDSEATVCPGPSCPVCSDGMDNDGDGATDYPADSSCLSPSSMNETCQQSEPVGVITEQVTYGDTTGAVNDFKPSCTSTSHVAPDLAYRLDLPAMATLTLRIDGFTPGHALLSSTCGGTSIACSTSTTTPLSAPAAGLAAGTYYYVVDGSTTGVGPWVLITSGTVAPGGSCEGALFRNGAFTCTSGHACSGTAGSRTCAIAACNDTIDSDGDGLAGFPADPGCTSINDNDEEDDCFPTVGPNCPACANGVDDDMDMTTDSPMDSRCVAPSFFSESFCPIETNVAGQITLPTTTGTLTGMASDFNQSCDTSTGADISFGLRLPVPVTLLRIDTLGSATADTVLSVWNASCTTELACDQDSDPDSSRSILALPNVAPGDYAIQVDGASTTASSNVGITLNVRGTVAVGTACTDELFATGVLACPSGTTCTGGTCQ